MRDKVALLSLLLLSGCGSVTVPAAVQTSDGTAMVGTTTAAVSGGKFSVKTPDGNLSCGGTYNALDPSPTLSVPVTCSDGRHGNIAVVREPDGQGGRGFASLSDGTTAVVAFGNNAGAIFTTPTSPAVPQASSLNVAATGEIYPDRPAALDTANPTTTSPTIAAAAPTYGLVGGGSYRPSSRVYTGNCPTPDSLDAAGRRCGARSAASRPGGYDGYGSWARAAPTYGGSTYVRGYYRKNGTYVRPHYRRR